MATKLPVGSTLKSTDVRSVERACFDGLLLVALSYGALLMIVMQLIQVLLLRPKRGRIFWGIIIYTSFVFVLATFAIGGRFRFAEQMYVEHRDYPKGYLLWYFEYMDRWENVLNQVCLTLLPWLADLLMLYRLYVLWNSQCWILSVPTLLHLGRMAVSIPILIITADPDNPRLISKFDAYRTAYYSLTTAINVLFTVLIITRLFMLREKVEQVLGKVQSVYYTANCTTIVESGALFTVWSMVHLILLGRGSWTQEVFSQPLVHLNAITRMLIILRMAQNSAWSRDIVTASTVGVLDWQVSSSHSIPLHDAQSGNGSQRSDVLEKLPRKFRDDSKPL